MRFLWAAYSQATEAGAPETRSSVAMWKTAERSSCRAVEKLLRQRQLAAAGAGVEAALVEEAAPEDAVLEEAATEVPSPAALLGAEAEMPPALESRESVR